MAHAPEDCTGNPKVTIQATGKFSKPVCEKLKEIESNRSIEVAEAETLENVETEVVEPRETIETEETVEAIETEVV